MICNNNHLKIYAIHNQYNMLTITVRLQESGNILKNNNIKYELTILSVLDKRLRDLSSPDIADSGTGVDIALLDMEVMTGLLAWARRLNTRALLMMMYVLVEYKSAQMSKVRGGRLVDR